MPNTYYVGPGGNNANSGLSWALRKLTLNGAEDIPVAAGDTVYVAPGTYRETLTCDVSGAAGSPITYIGDYSGAHTDGVGGVVRITGSNNDQTATRSSCITCGAQRDYRTFRGFLADMATQWTITSGSGLGGVGWVIEQCAVQTGGGMDTAGVIANGANQLGWTIRNCLLIAAVRQTMGVQFYHSANVDNAGHLVESCIFVASYYGQGVTSTKVGGITVRNCVFAGALSAVRLGAALTPGQLVTVNNNIIGGCGQALYATAAGDMVEDYNALFGNGTDRTNVAVGAHSNAYPALYDTRWFFQLLTEGAGPGSATQLVTPFDLASYSQLLNIAGTSPPATDVRGTAIQGAAREWGALEYDSTLKVEGGAAAAGGMLAANKRGNKQ